MSHVALCVLIVLQAATDSSAEIRVDSALLTLIEHADVSASDPGLVSLMAVKEGETVDAGKLLAKIDDREAKLIQSRAEAEFKVAQTAAENDIKVRFAKLSVAVAESELARAKESNAKFPKSVSQTEIERLKLLADKAVLEVEQAELDQQQSKLLLLVKQRDFERATLALERRSITAPFPGMVVQWKKQQGEWVESGTPMMRLIRLNRLRAEAFVTSQKLTKDLVGRPIVLTIEIPGQPIVKHEGKLVFVSPEIDPVNGQVRIWAEIDNADLSLRPGQSGTLLVIPAKTSQNRP